MSDNLIEHFRAFELLDDDEPMRGFTRVVRCSLRDWEQLYEHEAFGFERPFDVRFAKAMVKTLSYLVGTDADLAYGYAEHGDFSLLLKGGDGDESGETARRMVCRIASNAAARLSLLLGDLALFDVRLYQFPSPELARNFFLWRQQEQRSLSLVRHVRHALLSKGQEPDVVQDMIADFGEEEMLEILHQHAVTFEDLPIWQRRGAGCYWRESKDDEPPELTVDTTLPVGEQYGSYLSKFL